jgi:hypothetical protein
MYGEGRIIVASTPSDTPGHPFKRLCSEAESRGCYIKKTIWDNPRISLKDILDFAEEANCEIDWKVFNENYLPEIEKDLEIRQELGEKCIITSSTTWQREYLAEHVTEEGRAVTPEFTDDKAKELVKEWKRPSHFQLYGALDPGFNDFTAYLIGYYDFLNTKYVVEGEAVLHKQNTEELADEIINLETLLFPDDEMYLRVSDTDLNIIHDLQSLHNLSFMPTMKDNKDAQINHLRVLIQNNKIIIHPRCKNLIRQLKIAIWNKSRKSFERMEGEGHFDTIDALVYLIRNISTYYNPYPKFKKVNESIQFVPAGYGEDTSKLANAILGRRR